MNSRWSSDGDYDVELSSVAELNGREEVDKMAKIYIRVDIASSQLQICQNFGAFSFKHHVLRAD